MNIFDLNHIEAVEGTEVLGGGYSGSKLGNVKFDLKIDKDVDIKVDVDFDVDKDVNSKTDVDGNLATSEATADAFGKDTLSETETFTTVVEDKGSESFSASTSAA